MASTVWKGFISFGLVSVPVRLFAAARGEHVSFNQIHSECGGRIKQQIFCPQCDRVVERSELQKGYEVEKGAYVTVTPEELKNLEAASSDVMEIQQFVSLDEVDPIYFETSYYSAAEESGKRAYNLLFRGMTREKLAAIARLTFSGREQVVLIRPYDQGLLLHTLYYPEEVREVGEFGHDTASEVPEAEIQLAEKFMESLRAPFNAEQFQDTYKEKVMALIETKRAGQAPSPGVEKGRLAPVVDLMTALKQSIAEKERSGPTLVPPKTASAAPKSAAKKEPQRAGKETGAKGRKKAASE
ncbi:MAG TPA: Ku protein [Acidobacteriaceae bacterium]